MDCFLAPNAPVIAELRLTATLQPADDTVGAQRHVAADPVVGHVIRGPAVALEHDLLAWEALVGLLEAALVHAEPAAVTEGSLQDVLPAHAAVGGVAEQVRVAPAVLALAEDVPEVQLPARPLQAAPEGDEYRQQHGAQRPQDQVAIGEQALGGCAGPLVLLHLPKPGRGLGSGRAQRARLRTPCVGLRLVFSARGLGPGEGAGRTGPACGHRARNGRRAGPRPSREVSGEPRPLAWPRVLPPAEPAASVPPLRREICVG